MPPERLDKEELQLGVERREGSRRADTSGRVHPRVPGPERMEAMDD